MFFTSLLVLLAFPVLTTALLRLAADRDEADPDPRSR
jgi:heme/copper-type cytochrome/quinol oxidase subunit 1